MSQIDTDCSSAIRTSSVQKFTSSGTTTFFFSSHACDELDAVVITCTGCFQHVKLTLKLQLLNWKNSEFY